MRLAILVVLSAAFGAVLGMMGARSTLAPQLAAALEEQEELYEMSDRLSRDLSMAMERMQWVEVENSALRDQVDALQRTRGLTASQPRESAEDPSETPQQGDPRDEEPTVSPSRSDRPTRTASAQRNGSGTDPRTRGDEIIENERERVEDMLLREIQSSVDPYEQERLAVLHEHMEHVRDLYRELRSAQNVEERQEILDAVGQSRRNMRELVQTQQHDLMRRTLEDAGIDDATVQGHLIQQLEALQNSPYWTEPMMVWGMAADRQQAPR